MNLVARTGPGARDGPAHLDQVAAIKEAIPEVPIIANGNVITWNDIVRNLECTGADGITYILYFHYISSLFLVRVRYHERRGITGQPSPFCSIAGAN